MAQTDNGRRVRGLERAFGILDHIERRDRPLRPNEIAAEIAAPKSSVYEIINILLAHGILEGRGDGRVFLGRRLYFLGAAYFRHFDLAKEAETHLDHLARETGETAQLCILDGNRYVVVAEKMGGRPFRIGSEIGQRIPLPWTASGRLLLSHLSESEVRALVPAEDYRLPTGKVLSTRRFIEEIRQTRETGFFSQDTDVFAHCMAATIPNEQGACASTLCLVMPRQGLGDNAETYRDLLLRHAAALSQKLTGTSKSRNRNFLPSVAE